ncbi:hypothetical protein [Amycolatopsis magusensis]
MKALEQLPIEPETIATITQSRDKLRAFAGIQVDVLEIDGKTIRVRVEQAELKNNFLLNQSQLVSRAGAIFSPLGKRYRLYFVPVTYAPDLDSVTSGWIEGRMLELGLKRKDVMKQMGIDKATLSEMFSGRKNLTKFHKAAFYYYLLTYEINRDVREIMNEKS